MIHEALYRYISGGAPMEQAFNKQLRVLGFHQATLALFSTKESQELAQPTAQMLYAGLSWLTHFASHRHIQKVALTTYKAIANGFMPVGIVNDLKIPAIGKEIFPTPPDTYGNFAAFAVQGEVPKHYRSATVPVLEEAYRIILPASYIREAVYHPAVALAKTALLSSLVADAVIGRQYLDTSEQMLQRATACLAEVILQGRSTNPQLECDQVTAQMYQECPRGLTDLPRKMLYGIPEKVVIPTHY